ncbi:hypothetical protein TSUD_153520 [Trifolium subterraneum]|uniref:RNase H type-1 domain-containing protein n=1 Tax=Trifolium subterraneum TaxID=3900 RepID=A0A2Z6NAD8_TRISU|nr:hypothetical protein TSUD_153520 [Trifolium subterraneum]
MVFATPPCFLYMAVVWWLWRARNAMCFERDPVNESLCDGMLLVVHGFFGNLGVTNILHAEFMAINKGLILAWELNITDLWCYSDFVTAIKLLNEPVDEWHHYAAIITNIKDILNRDLRRVSILHTFREGNACADYLAKHGANNNEVLSSIANPPPGLNLFLLAYASGTCSLDNFSYIF